MIQFFGFPIVILLVLMSFVVAIRRAYIEQVEKATKCPKTNTPKDLFNRLWWVLSCVAGLLLIYNRNDPHVTFSLVSAYYFGVMCVGASYYAAVSEIWRSLIALHKIVLFNNGRD